MGYFFAILLQTGHNILFKLLTDGAAAVAVIPAGAAHVDGGDLIHGVDPKVGAISAA